MSKVKVYRYQVYIPKEGMRIIARRMGTAAYIASIGGTIVEGSELEVDSSDVDALGKTEIGFTG